MRGKARWRWTVLFQAGMFIAIQVVAIFVAVGTNTEPIAKGFLFWADLASIALVVIIMGSALFRYSRGKRTLASSTPR